MSTTPRHSIETWEEGQTQPNTVVNILVDDYEAKVSTSAKSATTDAQPASPTAGDIYIITGSATGTDWSTFSQHDIAIYRQSAWTAITPITGWVSWIEDTSDLVAFTGSTWTSITSGIQHKFDATVAPTATDDSGSGYQVGSMWIDVTADTAYVCVDATASSAVWVDISVPAGPLGKYDATVDPVIGDDNVDGYSVGSVWVNVTDDSAFICVDASTGAAVWVEITASGGGGFTAAIKTANYTATAGVYDFLDSSGGGFTVTLPASPSTDDFVILKGVGSSGLNNITIARNGNTINGAAEDFTLDQNYGQIELIYNGTTWKHALSGTMDLVNVNDYATGFSATNTQTGTTYTFVAADLTKCVYANNAAASTYNIPDDLAVDGETLNLLNIGAGTVTITVSGSDTLDSTANKCTQNEAITIICDGGDAWRVIGGTT